MTRTTLWSPDRTCRAVREAFDPWTGQARPVRQCDRCDRFDHGWPRGVSETTRRRFRRRNRHSCGREWLLVRVPCGPMRRRVARGY